MSLADQMKKGLETMNADLPNVDVIYNGKTYRAYMNSQDFSGVREDGGRQNDYTRFLNILTLDKFTLESSILIDGEKMIIKSVSYVHGVKAAITARREYYGN